MLVLEGQCPKCFGNLVLNEEDMSLICEDCGYHENTKDKKAFALALEEAEEWGPKDKRLLLSDIGKLVREPYGGLAVYLRETLEEAMRGLDLEDYETEELKKYHLIDEELNLLQQVKKVVEED